MVPSSNKPDESGVSGAFLQITYVARNPSTFVTPYLDYVSAFVLAVLVVTSFYGSWRATVRYYRAGTLLLSVGFLLRLVGYLSPRTGYLNLNPEVANWLGLGEGVLLLSGILMLTWYRRRLGL